MTEQTRVRRGMLTDEERALVVTANKERLPLVIATLHACHHDVVDGELQDRPCQEDEIVLGIPVNWNNIKLQLMDINYNKIVTVPWLSAVRVYRPDAMPPEDEIKRTIEAYGRGKVSREHPA